MGKKENTNGCREKRKGKQRAKEGRKKERVKRGWKRGKGEGRKGEERREKYPGPAQKESMAVPILQLLNYECASLLSCESS